MSSRWVVLGAAMLASLLAVEAVAAPRLPAPDGAFAVGVRRAEFVDASRRLDVSDPESGPRHLPSLIWYPAELVEPAVTSAPSASAAASGASSAPAGSIDSAYLAPEVAAATLPALGRTFAYSDEDLRPIAAARVSARADAPPLRRPGAFPVVVFSHGLLLYPEQNSALAARLASHGYIVVSVAHPLDAADQRLADGRVVASNFSMAQDDPRFAGAFDTLVNGRDLKDRREALRVYADAIGKTRLGRSLDEWRSDTLAVARVLVESKEPEATREVLAGADRRRLAFVGMSFGGATSATTCRRVPACRAAVNLDGQNFDPELFDASVERPLLLLLSDWTRYGLFKGQSREPDFSPNDLAYERWHSAGTDGRVLRVRLKGSRHMGFTDFVALLGGEKREARVGEIDGQEALSAVGDLVLAFLDVNVRGSKPGEVDAALRRHPSLQRHDPRRMKGWSRP